MSLRIAVQMDPLEKINISGDSTFAIMLGAQARGHTLFHYLAEDLTYQEGRVYAGAHAVTVQPWRAIISSAASSRSSTSARTSTSS